MLIRFLLLWVALSLVIDTLVFIIKRDDRTAVWEFGKRTVISLVGGAILVLPLFFLNNISGF